MNEDNIILNYGIEFECAFDMINVIDFFIKNTFIYENLFDFIFNYSKYEKVDNYINNIFKYLFKTNELDHIIDKYDKIKEIKINTKDNKYFEYIISNFNNITLQKEFIDHFFLLLNEIFNYIKSNNFLNNSLDGLFYYFLNYNKIDYSIINIIKYINDSYENIVIYRGQNDISKLLPTYDENFNYITKPLNDDNKIYLLYVNDESVICDNSNELYTTISNIKKNKSIYSLINYCEFISQIFISTDDVKNKLSILYNNLGNYFINCQRTSTHVHISFNFNNNIIKPDINHIIFITALSYIIQNDIFDYVLYFRNNNSYCQKLNHNKEFNDIYFTSNYNDNLLLLINIFFESSNMSNFSKNRYFWINILNLMNNNSTRPPTLEFRLKHGSNDAIEMSNFCKLYELLIKYAIKLSNKFIKENEDNNFNINDVIKFILKNYTLEIFKKSSYNDINYLDLIISYDIDLYNYFIKFKKRINIANIKLGHISSSNRKLYKSLSNKSSISGGILLPNSSSKFYKKPFYKITSFGYSFIGYDLPDTLKDKIKKNSDLNKYGIITIDK